MKRFFLYHKVILANKTDPKSKLDFKVIEHEYLEFFKKKIIEDKKFIFNLNFLCEKMNDKKQISFYQPKGEQISKFLFGLIENSEKLSSFKNVIDFNKEILQI